LATSSGLPSFPCCRLCFLFSYWPYVGNNNHVITCASYKHFGLVMYKGIQEHATVGTVGRLERGHPHHPWDFFSWPQHRYFPSFVTPPTGTARLNAM
jgi:hypothetical protein